MNFRDEFPPESIRRLPKAGIVAEEHDGLLYALHVPDDILVDLSAYDEPTTVQAYEDNFGAYPIGEKKNPDDGHVVSMTFANGVAVYMVDPSDVHATDHPTAAALLALFESRGIEHDLRWLHLVRWVATPLQAST